MQDILLGFLLLVMAVLLFASVVLEWGTILISIVGIVFVGVALAWMASSSGWSKRH